MLERKKTESYRHDVTEVNYKLSVLPSLAEIPRHLITRIDSELEIPLEKIQEGFLHESLSHSEGEN